MCVSAHLPGCWHLPFPAASSIPCFLPALTGAGAGKMNSSCFQRACLLTEKECKQTLGGGGRGVPSRTRGACAGTMTSAAGPGAPTVDSSSSVHQACLSPRRGGRGLREAQLLLQSHIWQAGSLAFQPRAGIPGSLLFGHCSWGPHRSCLELPARTFVHSGSW